MSFNHIQARAIHELAVRVFHVLGTDPENFEVEFSGTRRRSTRRAHNEANRLTKHVKASSVAANFYSKGTLSSLDTSVVGKANRRKPLVASSTAFHTNKNSCGLFSGEPIYLAKDDASLTLFFHFLQPIMKA